MKKVYIILVNYNGWKDTIECLESIFKSNYNNYQIVVVDNASPNNSIDYLQAWAKGEQEVLYADDSKLKHLSMPHEKKPLNYIIYDKDTALAGGDSALELKSNNPLVFIQSGENGGFAAGNNIGIKYALAKGDMDYVWLLNNDTVIEPATLNSLVDNTLLLNKTLRVGIVGAKLMYYQAPDLIQGVGGRHNKILATTTIIGSGEYDGGQFDDDRLLNGGGCYPIGASMFVSHEFVSDVGLMCEDYFLYFEEYDWVVRGEKMGWGLGYCWHAKVFHKEGGSINVDTDTGVSELGDYYNLRNRIYFTKKYYPYYVWIVLLSFVGVIFNRIFRKQFNRISLVFSAMKWNLNRWF